MSQRCRYCGTPLEGYETRCPGCGRTLAAESGAGAHSDSDFTAASPDEADWFMEEDMVASPARRRRTGASDDDRRPLDRAKRTNPAEDARSRKAAPRARSGQQARRNNSRPQQRRATVQNRTQLNHRQRIILLGALAVAAALLIGLSIHLIQGSGSNEPVYDFSTVLDTYFESIRTANSDKFASTRPPEYIAYLTTGTGGAYANEAAYRSEITATLDARLAGYVEAYGDVRAIRYHLTNITTYTHRCEALSNVLTSWYGFSQNEVTNAVIVDGTYSVQGTKDTGEFEFSNLLLIQIGDSWYFSPDAGSYWKAE